MKKLHFQLLYFVMLTISIGACDGCRKKNQINPDKTVATIDLLKKKTFKAIQIKESNVIVYRDKATNNIIPAYSRFRLTLDVTTTTIRAAKLIEYTGEEFNGRWNVVDDQGKLILRLEAMRPWPTNTEGVIEYEIKGSTEETLLMSSIKNNPKTGDTMNEYDLMKL